MEKSSPSGIRTWKTSRLTTKPPWSRHNFDPSFYHVSKSYTRLWRLFVGYLDLPCNWIAVPGNF